MTASALDGLQVLDLSDSIAGQFACRMMADFGARVILVEPVEGSPTRRLPPFDPAQDGTGSLLFFHLNLGKESVVLDRQVEDDRARLLSLIRTADVAVVGPDIDRAALQKANPRCVIALVSDFGADGPYKDWRGSEIIYQALSGMMYANGLPDREPLYGVGQRASIGAGVGTYIAVLSALYERETSGAGQEVSVDVAQNTAAMSMPTVLEYEYNGMTPERSTYRSPFGVVRCRDTWICFWLYNHAWVGLCDVLGRPEMAKDPRFLTADLRQNHWTELVDEVQTLVRERDADEVVAELVKVKLVAARVFAPGELWTNSPHLKFRSFWESVQTQQGSKPVLGPQFRMSATPRVVRGAPPALGQISDRTKTKPGESAVPASVKPGTRSPLHGVRVVEFTTAWAGPMAGRILGFLGAEVIHVESAGKLDLWRQHTVVFNERRYPGGVGGERPYNRNALFNSQNQNKKSFCIDGKHAMGKEALLRLAGQSDIILCNFTANTLKRMGFGYEAISKIKPDIIVVDMPGFGNVGPLANAQANGFSMEMAAGMSAMIGYPDGPPMTTGPFYPDPIGGYHGAAAALTALLYRQKTGQGQYVEVPQVEASLQYIGDELLAAIATGVDLQPQGNSVRWAAPHDAYRAEGDDEWVAVAVETDEEWRAFCAVAGLETLGADPRFATFAERHANQHLLREPITAWTSRHSKLRIADQLQSAGIRAAPVLSPKDVRENAYLAHRDAFDVLDHPEAGRHAYQTLPFRLSRTPGSQRTASPCLGAHTEEILTMLGYGPADIAALKKDAVISNIPA